MYFSFKQLMMKLFLTVLAALSLWVGTTYGDKKCDHVATGIDTSKYAVLKYEAARDSLYFKKGVKPLTLSFADLIRVDNLFDIAVKKHAKESKYNPQRPSVYYRQVIAVTNSSGRRIVWINCFCMKEELKYWKKDIVMVLDGGNCFFNVKIDLNSGKDFDFMVNGVA